MREFVECVGTVPVPLPEDQAFRLFTPEGERGWVPDWDPEYPGGGRPEPAVGLTFVTGTDETSRTWVITRFAPTTGRASYAYVLPGRRVALIDVAVHGRPGEGSRARITYRMTSLSADADPEVLDFAAHFQAMLGDWEGWIREYLGSRT